YDFRHVCVAASFSRLADRCFPFPTGPPVGEPGASAATARSPCQTTSRAPFTMIIPFVAVRGRYRCRSVHCQLGLALAATTSGNCSLRVDALQLNRLGHFRLVVEKNCFFAEDSGD